MDTPLARPAGSPSVQAQKSFEAAAGDVGTALTDR